MSSADHILIRPAEDSDLAEIVGVCGRALGWSEGGRDAAFFRWKHLECPFGRSPIWIAEDTTLPGPRIVGVRAMMRWRLERQGSSLSMTRAVDTATLPSHQGMGIFRRLTTAAVESLTADGDDAVFNTPNDQSRPGYLKMGWHELGRVPVAISPASPLVLLTMAKNRVAAEKWGEPCDVGLEPAEAFVDAGQIDSIIARTPKLPTWSTPLSADYLRWRTSFENLHCRVVPLGATIDHGFIVLRIRRRGELRQLSLLHIVNPDGIKTRRVVRALIADTDSDLAMDTAAVRGWSTGMIPLPRSGPILTWRPLADPSVPSITELRFPLGAIELF